LDKILGRPAGGYTVEPKIDGLAIAARYVDGELTQVATRGDGRAGEDVTTQARRAAGLPPRLREPVSLEVRGEVFMTDADFADANTMRTGHGEPAFAHPRSAAAGTLRAQARAYDAPLSSLTYAVHGFKGLLLKESGLTAIAPDMLYLAIFGTVALAIATPLFKRTL